MKRPPYPLLLILPLLFVCAKQGMPPGGPADKTPPAVIGTAPVSGTVEVDPGISVEVTFSEPMNRKSVEEAVFVSPRQDEAPSFRWKKNTLRIRPARPLDVPATYTVTIGAGASDLRGNRLVTSFSLALATGEIIADGEISGSVCSRDGSPQSALVGAWAMDTSGAPDLLASPPAYLTQADAEGRYRLPYLNDGIYRLLAYTDKNADGLFTSGRDMPGVAVADPVVKQGSACRQADLVLAPFDTTTPGISAVQPVSRTQVGVRFSAPLDRHRISAGAVSLSPGGSTVRNVFFSDESGRKLTVLCSPLTPGASCTVSFADLANGSGKPLDDTLTAVFTASAALDTSGPQLVQHTPRDSGSTVLPDDPVILRFSEALDTSRLPDVILEDRTDSTRIPWRGAWKSPLELSVRPAAPLAGNRFFTVKIPIHSCFDNAGNPGADTVVAFAFKTVPSDTLGTVLGSLTAATAGSTAYVVAAEGTGKMKIRRQITLNGPGAFRFDGLLPGTYRLFAFRDDNGNGRHDTGCPLPYTPAEPFRRPGQPVAVRAQWEVEGIVIAF